MLVLSPSIFAGKYVLRTLLWPTGGSAMASIPNDGLTDVCKELPHVRERAPRALSRPGRDAAGRPVPAQAPAQRAPRRLSAAGRGLRGVRPDPAELRGAARDSLLRRLSL